MISMTEHRTFVLRQIIVTTEVCFGSIHVVLRDHAYATWDEINETQREVGITFHDLAIPILQILLPSLQWPRNLFNLFLVEKQPRDVEI